jgi:hypothetical protein
MSGVSKAGQMSDLLKERRRTVCYLLAEQLLARNFDRPVP